MIEPSAYAGRRDALRERLGSLGLDAALVTSLVNVRYLSGFTGSNGALLVSRSGDWIATDNRYQLQVQEETSGLALALDREVDRVLVEVAGKERLRRVGFEEHIVTVAAHRRLLDGAGDRLGLVALGRPVEEMRAVKDEAEIELLRQACAIADQAFIDVVTRVRPGMTEQEVARRLDDRMRDLGASGPSFDTIVAAGENSAVPHHRPTGRALAAGDLVKADFGALLGGYHSDMTRTVVLGEPQAWQREVYDVVATAQEAGRAAALPGAECRAVDAAARRVVEAAGYGDRFSHGLGHGVGLEIHEAPGLGATATGRLALRMPVTIEPGVYLPGRGGVRIEDTLVVRADGPELLTTTTRDLLVC